jgi:hypothetical protein
METIRNRLLSTVLFAGAPFFFFPPKAAINARFGSSFEVAYYHFRQNHRNAVNLALHTLCLFVQLFGNFALANEIDARMSALPAKQALPPALRDARTLSIASAVIWAVVQFRSGAPLYVSALSTLCIALAYFVAPLLTVELMDAGAFGGFLIVLLLSNLATGAAIVSMNDTMKVFVGLPLLRMGFSYVEQNHFESLKAAHYGTVQTACIALCVGLPLLLRNPLKPLVISASLLLRVAYGLTGNKLLLFLGYGFFASLLQGICHKVVREEATLIALERKGDTAKLAFEYGHVVYFPNLAISSVLDALRGVPPPPKPEGLKD